MNAPAQPRAKKLVTVLALVSLLGMGAFMYFARQQALEETTGIVRVVSPEHKRQLGYGIRGKDGTEYDWFNFEYQEDGRTKRLVMFYQPSLVPALADGDVVHVRFRQERVEGDHVDRYVASSIRK